MGKDEKLEKTACKGTSGPLQGIRYFYDEVSMVSSIFDTESGIRVLWQLDVPEDKTIRVDNDICRIVLFTKGIKK